MHAAMFAPAGATLVVVGDRPEDELLDAGGDDVRARGARRCRAAPIDRDAGAGCRRRRRRPRSSASCRGPARRSRSCASATSCASRSTPDYHALLVLNTMLGGQFVSRLNLNLREDKGYTYGVRTGFDLRRGLGPFVMQTSVGTDVTGPAIQRGAAPRSATSRDARPATRRAKLAHRVRVAQQGLPARLRDRAAGGAVVAQLALHDLPDYLFRGLRAALAQVTADDVSAAARQYLDPEQNDAPLIVGRFG